MGLVDLFKGALELAKKLGNPELVQRIVAMQTEMLDLSEKVRTLREENDELRRRQSVAADLVWRDNVYWLGTVEAPDGPYCPSCWDALSRLARMSDYDWLWQCASCKHREPQPGKSPPRPSVRRLRGYAVDS